MDQSSSKGVGRQKETTIIFFTECPKVIDRFRYDIKDAPSTLVYRLMKAVWIPAKDGKFYPPKKMTRNELLDEFPYPKFVTFRK